MGRCELGTGTDVSAPSPAPDLSLSAYQAVFPKLSKPLLLVKFKTTYVVSHWMLCPTPQGSLAFPKEKNHPASPVRPI